MKHYKMKLEPVEDHNMLDSLMLILTNDATFYKELYVEESRETNSCITEEDVRIAYKVASSSLNLTNFMRIFFKRNLRRVWQELCMHYDLADFSDARIKCNGDNSSIETTEEVIMPDKLFEVRTFVEGKDVQGMSEQELLSAKDRDWET